jgi:hypothetical protein
MRASGWTQRIEVCDVTATANGRIPIVARIEGDFLESNLPARAFATLTTPGRISQYRLEESFSKWIQGIQAHNRLTLGWIKSIENGPQLHIHAALIAAAPVDCIHAAAFWQMIVAPRYSQAAIVEPYKNDLCGLGYVLKQLGNPKQEPQFSDQIRAFAPGCGKSAFRTNSAQRRQVRRIKAAMRQASMAPLT